MKRNLPAKGADERPAVSEVFNNLEDMSWIPSPITPPGREMEREEESEAVSALPSVLPRPDRAIVKRIAIHGDNCTPLKLVYELYVL